MIFTKLVVMIHKEFLGDAVVSGASLFREVRRLLQCQVLVIVLAGILAYVLGGRDSMVSALLGGLVGFLPNAFFAIQFGRKDPSKTANQVVKAFYYGETIKILFTTLLFVIVFQLPGILAMPLFIAFGAVMAVFWFSLLLRN